MFNTVICKNWYTELNHSSNHSRILYHEIIFTYKFNMFIAFWAEYDFWTFTVATTKITLATSGKWCSTACDHIQFFLGNLGQYFLLCQTILKEILSDVGSLELLSIHIHNLHPFNNVLYSHTKLHGFFTVQPVTFGNLSSFGMKMSFKILVPSSWDKTSINRFAVKRTSIHFCMM